MVLITISIILSTFGYFYNTHKAIADPIINDWSWTNPAPSVAESTSVDDIANQHCHGTYTQEQIVEEAPQWLCTQQSDRVKVGTTYGSRDRRTFVAFNYDTRMYPVNGTGSCEAHGECIYIPESDTFVTKQNLDNPIVRSLVIYKNFTKRLSRNAGNLNQTTGYSFDLTHPDYTFEASDGHDWSVESTGISNNGQWLAVEFRERGFGVLNMTTFEMKRFSTQRLSYGTGRDPTPELAITNNGMHVALMGTNYGTVTTFDAYPNCEDVANDRNMEYTLLIANACDPGIIDTAAFINRFYAAYRPEFNESGTELSFYARSYNDGSRAVTLQTSGYVRPRMDYLALGDSFTSGEGETDDSYYQQGTNQTFEKCHLSNRSYPYLIAKQLGIESQFVHSVACSGATTKDILGDDMGYWGQGGRLKTSELELDRTSKTLYQKQALSTYTPGRVHQISFIDQYKPKFITIGIGGNDVGFMEKLRGCVGPSVCEWANTAEGREKTAIEIQSAFDTLVKTYTAIQNASPQSQIYVVGYPKVINQNGSCSFFNGLLLDSSERQFMNEGITYINKVILAATQKVGITYIDIEDSFGDKVLCGGTQPSVMNAIRTGGESSVSANTDWLKLIGSESFHPKPTGHADIASAIIDYMPDLLTYNYCLTETPTQSKTCPNDEVVAPVPSNYWLEDGTTHGYAAQHVANFVSDSSDIGDVRHKTLNTENYSFEPGSTVTAEIHSNPIVLGSVTVNESGAISAPIELPVDLEEGFHAIHLYGTSYSGQPIDLYQVIQYALRDTSIPIVSPIANTSISGNNDFTKGQIAAEPIKNNTLSRQTVTNQSAPELKNSAAISDTDPNKESQSVLGSHSSPKYYAEGTEPAVGPTGPSIAIFVISAILALLSIGIAVKSQFSNPKSNH
jgi:lysophospholipase L1-like esterase